MSSAREHPLDAVTRRQTQWRKGLPYSRFGALLILLAFLAILAALGLHDLTTPQYAALLVFAAISAGAGLWLQRRAHMKAKASRAPSPAISSEGA